MIETFDKPWGSYVNLLDEKYTKVKKIVVKPGESPSYQYHTKRSEIWVIVFGTVEVRIDNVKSKHSVGDVVVIPKKASHQVTNIGYDDAIFIEIQLGDYFGEDDIVRLEDRYGRI